MYGDLSFPMGYRGEVGWGEWGQYKIGLDKNIFELHALISRQKHPGTFKSCKQIKNIFSFNLETHSILLTNEDSFKKMVL